MFCANDLMAIGAIDAVRERGLQVPDDVAVAGFDDVDAATIVNPPLTTAVNPAYDTGVNAGELLMSRLRGRVRRRRPHGRAALPARRPRLRLTQTSRSGRAGSCRRDVRLRGRRWP